MRAYAVYRGILRRHLARFCDRRDDIRYHFRIEPLAGDRTVRHAPAGKKITSLVAFGFWAVMLSAASFFLSVLPGSMGIGWTVLAVPMAIGAVGGGIGLLVVRSRVAKLG